jgi:hypothetical protein
MYIWLIRRRDRYPALPAMAGTAASRAEAIANALRELSAGTAPPPPASPPATRPQAASDGGPGPAEPSRRTSA